MPDLDFGPRLSRGQLLKGAAGSMAAVAVTSPLAGCLGDSSSDTAATDSNEKPKRGGILRAGLTGGSSADTFDALNGISSIDWARIFAVSEPLNTYGSDALPKLVLAEEMTPNADASEWTIRLRKGVEFHNGKELTADDLKYTFDVALDPKAPTQVALELPHVDPRRIKKVDKYTVRVPTGQPNSVLADILAGYYFNVIPVGYDPKKPIGTGPFRYKSFSPGVESVCVRNQNYWQEGKPYLDEVVVTNYDDETSQINGLLAGQVDVINNLSRSAINTLEREGQQVIVSEGGGFTPVVMRTDAAPFDDVRVRQAFRLTVDREESRALLSGGRGRLGNDVFSPWDPNYDDTLPQREHDPEQAKSLLRAAGHENLSVEFVTSPIAQGTLRSAQVFAQQAKDAGIDVKLRQVDPGVFFGDDYLSWTLTQDFWFYFPYLVQVTQATVPGGPYNETHFDNPRYNALYKEALAATEEGRVRELTHEMQKIDYEEGGYVITHFDAVVDASAPNVRGVTNSKTGVPLNGYKFADIWLK
jgi:peptide/nickel transport system substrate-binding protein